MTHTISNRLKRTSQNAQQLMGRIASVSLRMQDTIGTNRDKIDGMKRMLLALSPENTLKRGYSITRTSKGSVIRNAKDVQAGEEMVTTLAKGTISSVVRSSS